MSNNDSKCIARIWKNLEGKEGHGSRCTASIKIGVFCGKHGKKSLRRFPCREKKCNMFGKLHEYAWEHCGRYDEKPPPFFRNLKCYKINDKLPKNKSEKIINIDSDKSLISTFHPLSNTHEEECLSPTLVMSTPNEQSNYELAKNDDKSPKDNKIIYNKVKSEKMLNLDLPEPYTKSTITQSQLKELGINKVDEESCARLKDTDTNEELLVYLIRKEDDSENYLLVTRHCQKLGYTRKWDDINIPDKHKNKDGIVEDPNTGDALNEFIITDAELSTIPVKTYREYILSNDGQPGYMGYTTFLRDSGEVVYP